MDRAVDALHLPVVAPSSRAANAGDPVTPPVYGIEARAVSNWRGEAGAHLRPVSLAFVARHAFTEPAFVARCVKLNNYWCIKRARWQGEIGGDGEGHTGFASAADGADAAAQLLRRYYREFGRRTALSIVRRWAPAECRIAAAPKATASRPVSAGLAPLGLGRTVRARFLARHGRGGVPKRAMAVRGGPLRVQPWSPLARMGRSPAPKPVRIAAAGPPARTILPAPAATVVMNPADSLAASTESSSASRLAERFARESAALPSIAAGGAAIPLLDLSVPAPLCGNDEVRIRNYATRIAASVGLKVEDDLALFDAEGRPTPRLAPVMLAMSHVELGALRAGPDLVEAAVSRLVPAGASAPPPSP